MFMEFLCQELMSGISFVFILFVLFILLVLVCFIIFVTPRYIPVTYTLFWYKNLYNCFLMCEPVSLRVAKVTSCDAVSPHNS